MTAHRDLKRIIRDRQKKTGESYTAARAHVLRERTAVTGLHDDPADGASPVRADEAESALPVRADAAVLKVNRQSARVRILGEAGEVTFRSRDVWEVVPGQLVTLVVEKMWTWKDHAYASGRIENPRITVEKLGLVPLPLTGGQLVDLRSGYEPFRNPEPYAPLWRKLTAKPRAWFEMDPIAWGAFPNRAFDENPTCDAADLAATGDREGARDLLMDVLGTDLRCIDAHAHLGNLEFDRSPERALTHYEIGIRIGELSLPPGFDGVLVWGRIYNRPFLRCLHGYGLCLWRLGKYAEAQMVFERILSLNPHDNQGVRSCWHDVRRGRSWDEMYEQEDAVRAERRQSLH
ncbi:MAG: tetratricopeptide repeat protein [Polyangiaceae bacterium]|nr:tetratricopeptide repeat protein [Polyangiaceae bacterium]